MSDITAHPQSIPAPAESPAMTPVNVSLSPPAAPRPRLWPGIIIVSLQWILLKVVPLIAPPSMAVFMTVLFAALAMAALFALWWLFLSRVPWKDRFLVLLVCVGWGACAFYFFERTLRSTGIFGLNMHVFPILTLAWILWLQATSLLNRVAGRSILSWTVQRVGLLVVIALVWGGFDAVRFKGAWGDFSADFEPRWLPSAEEKALAEIAIGKFKATPADGTAAKVLELQEGDWPGFRGRNRDGRLTGVRINTDWQKNPPREVWRHLVCPGWSSFAVIGTHVYTQEQRGDREAVVCYDAETGKEIWAHDPEEKNRFEEPTAGPGPRATPTFHDGKIYALGVKGQLTCLNATTGKLLWTKNIAEESGANVPTWGYASSPYVFKAGKDEVVAVFAGSDKKSVVGYDARTGDHLWSSGEGKLSYCSVQPASLGGVDQLIIATEKGLTAFDPVSGKILWEHKSDLGEGMARVVQPALVGKGDVLLGTGFTEGTQRIHVSKNGDRWQTEEKWKTKKISPYYNDFVVHKDYIYGFDGQFFTCVSLEDGSSQWRARGYGNGQVLLLADQDLLLVLSEKGAAALVEASPKAHKELSRFQALDPKGKTWNHPVIAHGKLFVRNGEEMACYELEKLKE